MRVSRIKSFHRLSKGTTIYLEKDTQNEGLPLKCNASRQLCTMLSSNPILMAHFRTGKLLVVQGMTERQSNVLTKELLQETTCHYILKRYTIMFEHCSEMSQQRIWTEFPQTVTKVTPDTSKEKNETGLCQTSSPLDFR